VKRTTSQHESLRPGEHCRITEAEWFDVLESAEVLHQWGSALLVEEAEDGAGTSAAVTSDEASVTLVRAYWRDDSPAHRHTAWRFDAATSQRVRDDVAAIEQASSAVATLLAQAEARGSSTLDELTAQNDASEVFTQRAEDFYRELLRLGRPAS